MRKLLLVVFSILAINAQGQSLTEEPIVITNSHVVSKSYPNFWEDFIKVGGKIDEWNMG